MPFNLGKFLVSTGPSLMLLILFGSLCLSMGRWNPSGLLNPVAFLSCFCHHYLDHWFHRAQGWGCSSEWHTPAFNMRGLFRQKRSCIPYHSFFSLLIFYVTQTGEPLSGGLIISELNIQFYSIRNVLSCVSIVFKPSFSTLISKYA